MHFALSNATGFLAVPSNVIASVAVLGLLLVVLRRRVAGSVAVKFAAGAVALATLSPLGNLLLTPLEQRFPSLPFKSEIAIDGIIVLGGSYDTVSHPYLSTIFLREDTGPMAAVPGLAQEYPKARIIISGGTESLTSGPSEAAIVKKYFVSFGIAADRILIEEQSQTTAENARFSARLVHPEPDSRWLLVTSAYHMPRAAGAFRKAGFNVIACPAGWRTHGWHDLWRPSATATDNLRRVDVAVHEWLGLLFYRLSGYSDEWFAGPDTNRIEPRISTNTAAVLGK
jgi:uncharacterized SAM-binding protein YcdF (DUF218 family)